MSLSKASSTLPDVAEVAEDDAGDSGYPVGSIGGGRKPTPVAIPSLSSSAMRARTRWWSDANVVMDVKRYCNSTSVKVERLCTVGGGVSWNLVCAGCAGTVEVTGCHGRAVACVSGTISLVGVVGAGVAGVVVAARGEAGVGAGVGAGAGAGAGDGANAGAGAATPLFPSSPSAPSLALALSALPKMNDHKATLAAASDASLSGATPS